MNPNDTQVTTTTQNGLSQATAFSSIAMFESAQRMAQALAASTIVPREYQKAPANCLIAIEYAQRIGESPFVVMQNLNIIQGKPGLKAEYLIARLNTCGKFRQDIRFDYSGSGDALQCVAYTYRHDGTKIEGTPVSIAMAKAEGWFTRSGSKWQTMPRQMLAYRAASFFQRMYCPELSFGMQTTDEIIDIGAAQPANAQPQAIADLNAKFAPPSSNPASPEYCEAEVVDNHEPDRAAEAEVLENYEPDRTAEAAAAITDAPKATATVPDNSAVI